MARGRRAAGRCRERTWLGLLALGVALPYAQALPWLAEHGPDARLFVREVFATRVSSFFAWDVLVSAGTVLVLAATDDELPGPQRALVAGATLAGPSVGLPLHLWLRERRRRLR